MASRVRRVVGSNGSQAAAIELVVQAKKRAPGLAQHPDLEAAFAELESGDLGGEKLQGVLDALSQVTDGAQALAHLPPELAQTIQKRRP